MNITRGLLGAAMLVSISISAHADDMTMTHIRDAPSDLVVQRMNADGTWSTVCTGSCDRLLPSGASYRIDGPGLRTSKPFSVDGPEAWLTVSAGSWAGFAGGLTLTIIGVPAAGFGALGLLVDVLIHAWCSSSCGSSDDLLLPSALLTLGGTVASIAGVALIAGNRRTTVSGATSTRLPAWREIPTAAPPRVGAVGVPIVTATF